MLFLPPSNTHSRDSERRYTVSFRQLCGIKPSSCKSVYRQTATTAGLRTVNSSLCPGYWTYYCLITKHTRAHTHTHSQRVHKLCVGFNMSPVREHDSSVLFQESPKSTTNNNQHHHPVQILSELSITLQNTCLSQLMWVLTFLVSFILLTKTRLNPHLSRFQHVNSYLISRTTETFIFNYFVKIPNIHWLQLLKRFEGFLCHI